MLYIFLLYHLQNIRGTTMTEEERKRENLHIRIKPSILDRLRKISKETNTSQAVLVELALLDLLAVYEEENKMNDFKITNASDLRGVLAMTIVSVLEGKTNASQANAIANLSSEIHKSVRLEFDMRKYVRSDIKLEAQHIIVTDKKEQ